MMVPGEGTEEIKDVSASLEEISDLDDDIRYVQNMVKQSVIQEHVHEQERADIERKIIGLVKEKVGIDLGDFLKPDEMNEVVDFVMRELKINPRQSATNIAIFHPHINRAIKEKMRIQASEIERNRKELLEKMAVRFPGLTGKKWGINPHSDNELNKRFDVTHGNQHLTCYFDAAQFGIVSKKLRKDAVSLMLQSNSEQYFFDEYRGFLKNEILNAVNPAEIGETPRFTERGLHFVRSGGEAFNYLFWAYLSDKEKPPTVLITSEEYGEFVALMKEKKVNLVVLPDFQDEEQYRKAIQEIYGKNKIDFILVSSVSRRGTKMPIHLFSENKPKSSAMIIADDCQGNGRQKVDSTDTDVYFSSFHKGGEAGVNTAILALSGKFLDKYGEKIDITGTAGVNPMARAALAASPQLVRLLNESPETAEEEQVKKRARILNLAKKFVALAHLFPCVKILRPLQCDDPEYLSGIFEIEIPGADKIQLTSHLLKKFGVYVAPHYYDPISPQALRISLHPYMNDDSIKLLFAGIEEYVESNAD